MSTPANQNSSVWRVLGLYLGGSWVCLQVVDVLSDNFSLPDWIFPVPLLLLLSGLPVVGMAAYLHSRGRTEEADREGKAGIHRLFAWPNVIRAGVGVLAIWGVGVTGWLLMSGGAVEEGRLLAKIEEVDRLVAESSFREAYALVDQLDGDIRDSNLREQLWTKVASSVTIETEPTGVKVFRREYNDSSEWEESGVTPLTIARFPRGPSRVRFEHEGFEDREVVREPQNLSSEVFELVPSGTVTPGMVAVSGTAGNDSYGLFVPGLEQLPNLELSPFLMARTEVTNREYAEFVDAGGYSDPACWEEWFSEDDGALSFEVAISQFTDATGQLGPSTWNSGTYPAGEADIPVGGVSWYEAAAYACFMGMSLPTVYHWYAAANPFRSHFVVPLSNYGPGPAPVMYHQGVSMDGIYDLAGNVREWAANRSGDSHLILGGGWADQPYSFNDAVTAPSFDRSPLNGIRLVQHLDTTNISEAAAPIELAFRDYSTERPVSDEVFDVFMQAYSYDNTPLNARLISTDTTELAVVERIDMQAAYGGELLTAFLFLPPGIERPLQAVVFFPGSGDIYRRDYDQVSASAFDYILRSGRAVVYPIYRGTFERGTGLRSDIQDESNNWRDHVLAWSQDLRRSVDYLETRNDIDIGRLGYLGWSWGGAMAPVMLATEARIKAAVIVVGGLLMQTTQPIADPFHFLPRVSQPTLMVNARYDSFYPLETSGRPFFDHLGARDEQKRFVVIDANHGVLSYARNQVVGEALSWFDEYLGKAR